MNKTLASRDWACCRDEDMVIPESYGTAVLPQLLHYAWSHLSRPWHDAATGHWSYGVIVDGHLLHGIPVAGVQKAQRKPRTRELLGDGEEHRPGVGSVRDSQCNSRSGARGVDGRDAAGDQPRDATTHQPRD